MDSVLLIHGESRWRERLAQQLRGHCAKLRCVSSADDPDLAGQRFDIIIVGIDHAAMRLHASLDTLHRRWPGARLLLAPGGAGSSWLALHVEDGAGDMLASAGRAAGASATQRLAVVLDTTSEGVIQTDPQGIIQCVNRAFTRVTGYSASEAIGRTPRILQSGRHGRRFYDQMFRSLAEHGEWAGEIWNRRRDGRLYPERLCIRALYDAHGAISNYVGVFSDLTHVKDSESQLRRLAERDALTGVPNRATLLDRLHHRLARDTAGSERCALVLIDLLRFRAINDSYGHLAGDLLLREAAHRLGQPLSAADTLARVGSDEFGVLVERIEQAEDAGRVAVRLIEALGAPLRLEGGPPLHVDCSAGIAVSRADDSAQAMLQRADAGLHRARLGPPGTFAYGDEAMTRQARQRLELESRLRHAVDHGLLEVHYQPQVDVASQRITGAEALVRWTDTQLGSVPPARFIPVAEQAGLVHGIGEQVLHTVSAAARDWHGRGLPAVVVAVNVSPLQVTGDNLVTAVDAALCQLGHSAVRLQVEVTEGTLMTDPVRATRILHQLREMGVLSAVDDFGTGYSSLAYLKRFPLDQLKIDRSFIAGLPGDSDDAAIARSVIALARGLGLEVLAEGVETTAQLAYLARERCDRYQGYLCSAAVPCGRFEQMLGEQGGQGPVPGPAAPVC